MKFKIFMLGIYAEIVLSIIGIIASFLILAPFSLFDVEYISSLIFTVFISLPFFGVAIYGWLNNDLPYTIVTGCLLWLLFPPGLVFMFFYYAGVGAMKLYKNITTRYYPSISSALDNFLVGWKIVGYTMALIFIIEFTYTIWNAPS